MIKITEKQKRKVVRASIKDADINEILIEGYFPDNLEDIESEFSELFTDEIICEWLEKETGMDIDSIPDHEVERLNDLAEKLENEICREAAKVAQKEIRLKCRAMKAEYKAFMRGLKKKYI